MKKTPKCIICNKPLRETQLFFCGTKCKDKYYNTIRKNKTNGLKCLVCGKKLTGNQRMYCSNQCRWKKHGQVKRKKDYFKQWQRKYQKRDKWKKYHKQYSKEYRIKTRDFLRECLGNKCFICGFEDITQFHHLDERNGKKDDIISVKKIEGGRVILLCPNHHFLVHGIENKKITLDKDKMLKKAKSILIKNKSKLKAGKIKS